MIEVFKTDTDKKVKGDERCTVRLSRVGLSAAVTPSPYGLLFHHDTHIASNHINLLPPANLAKYQQIMSPAC